MVRIMKFFLIVLVLTISGNAFAAPAQIRIGSKNSADHVVLGKALFIYLRIHRLPVVDMTDYGRSMDLRRAILVGDIDLYFESLSTGWFNYFHKKSLERSADYLFSECKKLDRKNNLYWFQYTPANRTFALIMEKLKSSKMKIKSISDWVKYIARSNERITILLPKELNQSQSLMEGLVKYYSKRLKLDGKINYRVIQVSHLFIPRLVSNGAYFAGLSFSTLGRIDGFDLRCLKDDLSYFPAYNLCPVVRKKIVDQFARLPFLLNVFSTQVTTEALRRFDYLVSEERKNPSDVAEAWLVDHKLATPEEIFEYGIR